MKVVIAYAYTAAADVERQKAGIGQTEWAMPQAAGLIPLIGDCVQFGEDISLPLFFVRNRTFIWVSTQELTVQVLLDVGPEPEELQP